MRWSYHTAATLGDYTIAREAGVYHLRATVTRSDPALLQQQPLVLVLSCQWRWPILEYTVSGQSLTARLGAMEVSDGAVSGGAARPGPAAVVG